MNLSDDLQFANDLARSAAALVREFYGKTRRLTKRGDEAVTEADRASQRLIVAALRKRFPADGIIGEENETGDAITFDVPNPNARNWVIDPIDGTNNFIAGLGAFAVCIGLLDAGRPVLGVVYDVTRDFAYFAARGLGAFAGTHPISAAKTPLGDTAMLMLTSNLLDANGRAPNFPMRWLSQTNWKIRIIGSAALEAAQVAAGVAHGAVTLNGKLWDAAAPAAIVLEAGGIITDPKGKEIFPFDLKGYTGAKVPFLAAAPSAHADLLKEINL
jgi:fructose-1,6-bisphosphatase/inositol monophosphatase family enzyme